MNMKHRVINLLLLTIIFSDPIIQVLNHGTGH
jgi:hypothetical protein